MARAPFQVLVVPYHLQPGMDIEYAIFKRSDFHEETWQGLAGGGEDDETPLEAAKREAWEEAGISPDAPFLTLDSMATVPVIHFGSGRLWGDEVFVIPEYCFGVRVTDPGLLLSPEHAEYRWVAYDVAFELLTWENNKNALWELHQRLCRRLKQL